MDLVVRLAKMAAVGEGSPFSSAVPGGGAKAPAAPKAPAASAAMGSPASAPAPKITPPAVTSPAPPVAPSPSTATPPAAPAATPPAATPPAYKPPPTPPMAPSATVTPQEAPEQNEQFYRFMEQMSPMMMASMGKGVGQMGGLPALMAMWNMIGGNRGQHMQTIFGGPGGVQDGHLGSYLGSAAASSVPTAPAAAPPEPPTVAAPPQSGSGVGTISGGQSASGTAPLESGRQFENPQQAWRDQWQKDTSTGKTMIGNTPVDIGNAASDMGGNLGMSWGLNRALGPFFGGKRPGMTVANFGTDALDLVGLNPASPRFGQGLMSATEASQAAENVANQPALLRAIHGWSAPITTLYGAGALANTAAKDISATNANAAQTMNTERGPDGEPKLEAGVQAQDTGSWAGNITENALQRMDEWQRRKAWREWAAGREQQLANVTDPTQKAQADAELARVRQRQTETAPGRGENLYNNIGNNDVASLGQIFRGEAHMPWSEDTSAAELNAKIKRQEQQTAETHRRNHEEWLRRNPGAQIERSYGGIGRH